MGKLLDKYIHIKTAQDMIDAKIMPMNSSDKLGLNASLRLRSLKERLDSELSDGSTGRWIPAIVENYFESGEKKWIKKEEDVIRYARPDMRFEVKRDYQDFVIQGLEGKIVDVSTNRGETKIAVELDREIIGGNSLDGRVRSGHGLWIPPEFIKLYAEGRILDGYTLAPGVVADNDGGHLVRFSKEYSTPAKDSSGGNLNVTIPARSIGTLRDATNDILDIKFNEQIDRKWIYKFRMKDVQEVLEVSSLGQFEPQDIETAVYKEAMNLFYPRTRLDSDVAEMQLIPILSSKDMIMHGPPGSGKSQVVKDILEIAKMQEVLFKVKGCQSNCNPYSLIDPIFAKQVFPCDECCTKYNGHKNGNFLEDRIFRSPDPKDVPVTVSLLGDGNGIETMSGNPAINHMNTAGWKMPNGKIGCDQASLEGLNRGSIPRSNNGYLNIDEIDKMPQIATNDLLMAINDDAVKQNQVRFLLPGHSLIMGTANDIGMMSEAINDRMFFHRIGYSKDIEITQGVVRVSSFKEFSSVEEVEIGDMHILDPLDLRNVPIPYIATKAIISTYFKFMNEYSGPGMTKVSPSNRSRQDALLFASAKHHIDSIFFKDTPAIITPDYVKQGMKIALRSRVCEIDREKERIAFESLENYVEKEFGPIYESEKNVWWCKAYKHISFLGTQVSKDIKENFDAEISMYEKNPKSSLESFSKIWEANMNPDKVKIQDARIDYPFMEYLFSDKVEGQPRIMYIKDDKQKIELIDFFMKSKEGAACYTK